MINKLFLLGRVGNKDVKTIKNGSEMVSLSIATSRKYYDSKGDKREQTTWHTVNVFNKLADIANKYVHVGDIVSIIGEVLHRKVEDEKGTRWIYSVTANEINLIPGQKKENNKQEEESSSFEDDFLPF